LKLFSLTRGFRIYLHPLDKYWAEHFPETKLIRYCDDFVILMRSKAPERYLQRLQTFLTRLRVTLSPEKTQARQAEEIGRASCRERV
jgi:RNA-directed DNA polymerase